MRLSRRATSVGPMELAVLSRSAQSDSVIDIALGIPDLQPPEAVVEGAMLALRQSKHQYSEPNGLLELRCAVAKGLAMTRGLVYNPYTEITITCGATEGLFDALIAVTDPGDEVLLLEPHFELYPGMITLVGATPRSVPLRPPDWR